MFEGICPILKVTDLAASLDYYVRSLGFVEEWRTPMVAGVGRDAAHMILVEGSQGNAGTYVWIGVEDVDKVYEEYRVSGAHIRHEPLNFGWALEMKVQDPDGHVLRIGSEMVDGRPLDEWRD